MSELKGAKMEGSKVPAEEIKNPDLVAAMKRCRMTTQPKTSTR